MSGSPSDLTAKAARYNEPIDGAQILNDMGDYLARFVAYPDPNCLVAHTLWLAHTHFMDAWDSTPRLAFLSPEPGSGKSRGLEVSEPFVPRPIEAVNVTVAYLFRKVGDPEGRPTILYDEIDTVFGPRAKENEEIRGLLNAGHRKHSVAGRCVVRGKQVETEEIPAYSAVALAGLGNLPDTILTRSVVIPMRRRRAGESVEPYRKRVNGPQADEIRERLERWAQKTLPKVTNEFPDLPPSIVDRDADVWEPLISVADAAGGDWPSKARVAAVALVAHSKQKPPSLGIQLLADIRDIFGNRDVMSTEQLLRELNENDECPWGDLRGRPLDARRLSSMLRPYGVSPTTVRINVSTPKGYRIEDLHDPFERYLGSAPSEAQQPQQEPQPDGAVADVALVADIPEANPDCFSCGGEGCRWCGP